MATRNALKILSRRFSSGKEEKAAKNVFIKQMEQEKLEKIAQQGPGEQAVDGSASGAKLRRIQRFSSGKVLSEEERAAGNVFIKKMEQEKLEKMAQQLDKIARQLTQVVEGREFKARDDKARADVVAIAILGAIGWWFIKSD